MIVYKLSIEAMGEETRIFETIESNFRNVEAILKSEDDSAINEIIPWLQQRNGIGRSFMSLVPPPHILEGLPSPLSE